MGMNNYYLLDDMEKYDKDFKRELYEDMRVEEIIPIFREYYKNRLPIDLLTWSRVNQPKEEMIYKDGFWNQIKFIRDTIMELMSKDYKEYENNPALVINTHRSKSIDLPVYKISLFNDKIKMIIRNNFYDWKISVDSNIEINADFMNIFDYGKKINSVYCEGFEEEQVFGSFNENKKQFTIEIGDTYQLYTFMFILKNFIKSLT